MTEASSQDHEITDWPACIVREARTWLGTPYLHQASVRGAGCDCLGLVRGVWRALYGREPEAVPQRPTLVVVGGSSPASVSTSPYSMTSER